MRLVEQFMAVTPGLTRDMAEAFLFDVVQDFYTDTGVWQVELEPVDVMPGQARYPAVSPVGHARVEQVVDVRLGGVPLPRLLAEDVVDHEGVTGWLWTADRYVHLFPTPSVERESGLRSRAILVPIDLRGPMPGAERWGPAWLAGAQAKLALSMPRHPGANGPAIPVLLRTYHAARTRAKVTAGSNWTFGTGRNAMGGRA
ncbi:MAG: hypothetical protein NZ518_02325 [Dehalococcoidia bacterium]|nr:hypothetical protein [Dehalococcoidia bacterium]